MSLEVENLNLEPLFKHFKDIFASKGNLKDMKMLQTEINFHNHFFLKFPQIQIVDTTELLLVGVS